MAQSISHQQQLLRDSWLTSASTPSPPTPTMSGLRNSAANAVDRRGGRETIHSGQFMVSHFEAEEQDDEDTEIAMPEPDESGAAIIELNSCTDVQLLNCLPSGSDGQSNTAIVPTNTRSNSSAVIDISLAKLFKCMNLAYRQKLTSPKWNTFKGIRLRWKDKIRLNNLIWRCWHMQFILRRKTLVCQFASPLDVDLHSKPEAVVLEGKYWKRQFDVIKAEYMKWRRFYRNRGLGANAILDTVSEIDVFDWSPTTNDKNLMGMDDYCWTADTLFSTINTPFPFPDPREIAKAGIADFIQPSLGPLQPNLDDFMNGIPLQELINTHLSSRLPPVPEEGTEDVMFRSDVYDFPAIMETEPMDSNIMQETDANDLGTGIEQSNQQHQRLQDALIGGGSPVVIQQSSNNSNMMQFGSPATVTNTSCILYSNKMFGNTNMQQQHVMNLNATGISPTQIQSGNFMTTNQDQSMQAPASDLLASIVSAKKRQIKERGIRAQLPVRREPHNYDKSTPTQHQTNIYNQMIAQQNRNQMQMQQQQHQQLTSSMSGVGGTAGNSTNLYLAPQNVQPQLHTSPIQTTTNNYMNALNLSSNNNFTMPTNQINHNMINIVPTNALQVHFQQQQQQQQQQQHQSNIKSNSNLLSLLAMKSPSIASDIDTTPTDSFKATSAAHPSASYKPYPTQQTLKNSSYNQLSPRSLRMSSPPTHQMNPLLSDRQNQLNANASAADKEMFRSKSLPMNSTLQMPIMRDEPFAVPKYQATKSSSARFRVRSNSMVSKNHSPNAPSLQTAASEPMLKTLAQLLTSTSSTRNASSSNLNQASGVLSNSLVSQANAILPQQQQKQQQQQQQRQFLYHQSSSSNSSIVSPTSIPQMSSNPNSPHGSYMPNTNSNMNLASTPSLSPDLMHDPDLPLSPTQSGSTAISKYSRASGSPGISGNSTGMPANLSPGSSGGGESMQRRVGHIHAEQKRRYNIKNGFDMLHSLIPQLQQNPNAKLSKAAMLQKGAEYIRQLRTERDSIKQKMESLRMERDALNNSLNHLHSVLPANGAPVTRQRTGRVKDLYNDYVRERTLRNWKFWILGLIFEPLLNSYNTTVSVANMEELYRSTMIWVDQHCSLIEIRPAVSDKLRYLSTTTDILSDPPSTLQEEVLKAISGSSGSNSSNLL